MLLKRIIFALILQSYMLNTYAYYTEHNLRIINTSQHSLLVDYQICDLKKIIGQSKTQSQCSELHQVTLSPSSEPGFYFELNFDSFDTTFQDRINGYILYHQILIHQVATNNEITRFRTSPEQIDDPNNRLSPWCTKWTGDVALILSEYGNLRYHCK